MFYSAAECVLYCRCTSGSCCHAAAQPSGHFRGSSTSDDYRQLRRCSRDRGVVTRKVLAFDVGRYRRVVPVALTPLAASWEDRADQATVLGVAIALGVGIATTIVMIRQEKTTRKGQQAQQQQSEAAATRAEMAARLTEIYTQRVVDALETIASQGIVGRPAKPLGVRWSLKHFDGDRYVLTNEGDEIARNVVVTSHKSLLFEPPEPVDLDPGGSTSFIALIMLVTSDTTITVSWDDESGTPGRWQYPLPPNK